jgi:hypothetical protein
MPLNLDVLVGAKGPQSARSQLADMLDCSLGILQEIKDDTKYSCTDLMK